MVNKNILALGVPVFLIATWLTSCSSDEPFQGQQEGQTPVSLNVSFNSNITRSDDMSLNSTCNISLYNGENNIGKWIGIDNIPQTLYLRYGSYSVSLTAGDSVPASFDKKYYTGYTEFELKQNSIPTKVNVVGKIRNTVVSIDASGLPDYLIESIKIDFNTSDGSLSFNKSNLNEKGYFMRKYDQGLKDYEDIINYSFTVTDLDGSQITKTGIIEGVKAAHEYKLILENNSSDPEKKGGALINLLIQDYALGEEDIFYLPGQPDFIWEGNPIDISQQIYDPEGDFKEDFSLIVTAYESFRSLVLSTEDPEVSINLCNQLSIDLEIITEKGLADLAKNGTGVSVYKEITNKYHKYHIIFSKEWLKSLRQSTEEYVLDITAVDQRGFSNNMKVRIANTEDAQDAPFSISNDLWTKDYLSIRAHSADVKLKISKDNIQNLAIKYKKTNDPEWNYQSLGTSLNAGEHSVKLTGLDPNSKYEICLVGGEVTDGRYQYDTRISSYFTTEEEFQIPNYSLEDWSDNGKVKEPFAANLTDSSAFWDTGNHGSTTISASDNLTVQNTQIKNTGNSCAALTSKFVGIGSLGKHGAGNLFSGVFEGTTNLTHGIIRLGREYNGTHPSKLRVWVNYRPKENTKSGDNNYIPKGTLDKGQIYIALSTSTHTANTSQQNTLVLEDNLPDEFIAYNQITFDSDFGANDKLEMVEIPFNYFEKAHTLKPQYIVIVCSASKYGDYFYGGEGSTMYVDDFELIYE